MRACPPVRKPPSCVGTRRFWYAGVSPAVFPASRGRDARVPQAPTTNPFIHNKKSNKQ